MNRRQEITVYVVGAILAGVSAYNGHEHEEWLFSAFVPVLILGVLAVYALRTRTPGGDSPADLLKKGLGVTMAVVVAAQILTQVQRAQAQVSSAESDIQAATSVAEHAQNEVDDAKREAEAAKSEVELVQSEVAGLQAEVHGLDSQLRNLELGQLMRH